MLSRLISSFLKSASGRAGMIAPLDPSASLPKKESRRAGVRGETLAYLYLRRHKFRPVAKNYTSPNVPGEIDFIGYDGPVLAFVEVKYHAGADPWKPRPEDAVDQAKRRNLLRIAHNFLAFRKLDPSRARFDVLTIEARPASIPVFHLHKAAFAVDAAPTAQHEASSRSRDPRATATGI
jgi:Holliday junction resolvase-like predicted endonuclease